MKDVSEAQLIEMQNRAIVLLDALDVDLESSLKIADMREIWDAAETLAEKVSADVDALCAFVRTQWDSVEAEVAARRTRK